MGAGTTRRLNSLRLLPSGSDRVGESAVRPTPGRHMRAFPSCPQVIADGRGLAPRRALTVPCRAVPWSDRPLPSRQNRPADHSRTHCAIRSSLGRCRGTRCRTLAEAGTIPSSPRMTLDELDRGWRSMPNPIVGRGPDLRARLTLAERAPRRLRPFGQTGTVCARSISLMQAELDPCVAVVPPRSLRRPNQRRRRSLPHRDRPRRTSQKGRGDGAGDRGVNRVAGGGIGDRPRSE